MRRIAVGIFCKTPLPSVSKTRLSPPLRPDECAAVSACFIRDLAAIVGELCRGGDVAGYAVHAPAGTERALQRGGSLVLSPAHDGGYVLIGLSDVDERLFASIPWSTPQVHQRTVERANEIGLPVVHVPGDVGDAASLALLIAELGGERPPSAPPGVNGAPPGGARVLCGAPEVQFSAPLGGTLPLARSSLCASILKEYREG